MKVCVFGAGAVGGYLAARLLDGAGHEVSVVARGDPLRAIAAHGLTLLSSQAPLVVHPAHVTDRPRDLGVQDVVFVTLKAHSQAAAAGDIAALLGPSGAAVFVSNGIPWWWDYRGNAAVPDHRRRRDATGALWTSVGPERSLGCVVYSANEVVRPGVVRHAANNHWLLGEPDGTRSERVLGITRMLCDAKLHAEAVTDIRSRVWAKLLRNAPLNSLCALTRLPVHGLARDPALLGVFHAVIDEIVAIAAADGVDLSDRVEVAKAAPHLGAAIDGSTAGPIRPSMLQDILQGRPLEVDAILGQVQAIARATRTACPVLDILVPLVRGLDLSTRPGAG